MTVLRVPPVVGQEEGGGGLAAWAERTGRRRVAEHGRAGLRFAFYGRVSTEDYQDPVTSLARQRDLAAELADPGRGRDAIVIGSRSGRFTAASCPPALLVRT